MRKGIGVYVYKTGGLDTSCGGVSATHDRLLLVGPGVPEILEEHPSVPTVELLPANIGDGFRVVPVDQPGGAGPMFGGAFVWSTDSRFRNLSEQPIALHDRWEAQS